MLTGFFCAEEPTPNKKLRYQEICCGFIFVYFEQGFY